MRAARSAAHLHSILELLLLHLQPVSPPNTYIYEYVIRECFVFIIRTIQFGGQHPVGLLKLTMQLPYIDKSFRLMFRRTDIQTTTRQTFLKKTLRFKYASIILNVQ